MDDVTLVRSGPYSGRYDTGAEFDVYECLVVFEMECVWLLKLANVHREE